MVSIQIFEKVKVMEYNFFNGTIWWRIKNIYKCICYSFYFHLGITYAKESNKRTHRGRKTSRWIAIPRDDYRRNGVKMTPRKFGRQQTARHGVRTWRAALYHKGVERLYTVKWLMTRHPATFVGLHVLLWLLRWDQGSQTGSIMIIVRFRWRVVFARRSSSWVLPYTGPLWHVINICNRIKIYMKHL